MSSGNVRNEVQEKDEAKERERKKGNAGNIDIDFSNDTMGPPKQIPCSHYFWKYIGGCVGVLLQNISRWITGV